jgi:hypothetical protein
VGLSVEQDFDPCSIDRIGKFKSLGGSKVIKYLDALSWQEINSSPIADLPKIWIQANEVLTRLSELTRIDPIPSSAGWIDEVLVILSRWKANLGRANAWMDWNSLAEKGMEIGLQSLVDRVRRDEVSHSSIEEAAYVAYVRWWIDQVVSEDATLRPLQLLIGFVFLCFRCVNSSTRL